MRTGTSKRSERAQIPLILQHEELVVDNFAGGGGASTGNVHGVVTAHITNFYTGNTCGGEGNADQPLRSVTAGGQHQGMVNAYCIQYYRDGGAQDAPMSEPMRTVPSKDRIGQVQVFSTAIPNLTQEQLRGAKKVAAFLRKYLPEQFAVPKGVKAPEMVIVGDYIIVDIGMRMLTPRELARAQGFPDDYLIEANLTRDVVLTKTAQVRMIGNSVCPPLAAALVRANFAAEMTARAKARRIARRADKVAA